MEAVGAAALNTAMAPATWGLAIEVPVIGPSMPPGMDEVICVPGASRSRVFALFEVALTASGIVVLPTLITAGMQAGGDKAAIALSFPEAATTAMRAPLS